MTQERVLFTQDITEMQEVIPQVIQQLRETNIGGIDEMARRNVHEHVSSASKFGRLG